MTQKFIDRDGLKVLWNQVNLKDYPNNETLMAVIDAIDETKADKNELFSKSWNDLEDKPFYENEDGTVVTLDEKYLPEGLAKTIYVDEQIATKADVSHSHDNIYYTENEIDQKLSTINTSIANITSGSTPVKEAEHSSTADTATNATNANHATSADSATSATSATKATQDGDGKNIAATYETKSDASSKLEEAKEYTNQNINDIEEGFSNVIHQMYGDDFDENGVSTIRDIANDEATTALTTSKDYTDERTSGLISTTGVNNKITTHNSSATSHSDIRELISGVESNLSSHAGNTSNPHSVTLSQLGVTATTAEINYLDGVTSAIQGQLDGKSASGHIHSYAGSSSAGGAATSANKLNTDAGSATQPIYFEGGIPKATTYTLGKSVPSDAVFTDTNTHYTSKNVVGSSTATSNTTTALTNGNVYLNSVENGAVTSTNKISGSGATTVTTDTSGNIVISSTDNNTTYSAATTSANGLMSSTDKSKLDGIATGANNYTHPTHTGTGTVLTSANENASLGGHFNVQQVNVDTSGHVTSTYTKRLNLLGLPSHEHATGDITSGTLGVARGGTGRATLTSGYFLRGNGTSAVTQTKPASVRSAIGVTEGTWTPSFHGGGSPTVVATGRYLKSGNLVIVHFYVNVTGTLSGNTSSYIYLDGLPYAPDFSDGSVWYGGGGCFQGGTPIQASGTFSGYQISTTGRIYPRITYVSGGINAQDYYNRKPASGANIHMAGTIMYYTAS